MTKTEFLKKLKAGLLAGTMAATLSACGEEPEKEKESTTTAIVTEDTTEETKTTTVEDTTNESKETKENTTNKEEKTENNTEVVENPTKGENKETKPNNTTSNNATPTSEETKENTPSNTTKNNTTPVVTQRTQTPVTTKATSKTTQKVTTKATPTTTKAVQTQAPTTTAAPIVTTVATIPYRERSYTKNDLTSDDEVFAKYAIDQLGEELAKELFNGYVGPRTFSGEEEAIAIIIALNSNQSINRNVIGHYHRHDTNEEFNNSCDILDIAYYQYNYNSNVDFSKYVLNDEFADFINNICKKYKDYMSGDTDSLSSEFDSYFSNNSVNIDNCIEYYFMCKTKESLGIDTPELENARQLYYDEVLSPLYSEFESNRHYIQKR